jgi:hypothetical protein
MIPELMGGRSLSHPLPLAVGNSSSKMYVGGQAAAAVAASAALVNDAAETSLNSYAIPANSLVAGSTIRVRSTGTITAFSTGTFKVSLKLGPTTTALASREEYLDTGTTGGAAADIWYIDALIQIRTIGATGTAVAMIDYQEPDPLGTATKRLIKASVVINTTVEQTLNVTGDWSAANAGNSARSDMFVVDIVNPGV